MKNKLVLVTAFIFGVVAPLGINGYFLTKMKSGNSAGTVNAESIKQFLTKNPEVILKTLALAQEKIKLARLEKVRKVIKTKTAELETDTNTPWFGSAKPNVTLVLFSDYNCGYCKQVAGEVQKLVKEDKNVRVVHKDFPILAESSVLAARGSLAAFRLNPGAYQKYHFAMLEQSDISKATILATAKNAGYDIKKFEAEMNKPELKAQLIKNQVLAQSLGINGTPAFILGGELIPGAVSVDELKKRIAMIRTGKGVKVSQK